MKLIATLQKPIMTAAQAVVDFCGKTVITEVDGK